MTAKLIRGKRAHGTDCLWLRSPFFVDSMCIYARFPCSEIRIYLFLLPLAGASSRKENNSAIKRTRVRMVEFSVARKTESRPDQNTALNGWQSHTKKYAEVTVMLMESWLDAIQFVKGPSE
ncbi:hypothetical protein CSKR_101403 [Clonorchis sinensis]|uniref:Uncharacterized protein n=2 Tax=Clonorchis sinensis TaxID=79923 RepID=G7YT54_CLOSI|nr:hypothetical protein CSKR_101403 [Clonorchis sinensis]GAA56134.1 hypothetical protein CLF_110045 [Clonorchis sinensis]